MVFNRRDLTKAFSPKKRPPVKRLSGDKAAANRLPSVKGSTTKMRSDPVAQTNIKVIVRVRPPNEKECQDNYKSVLKVIDRQMLVFDPKEEVDPFYFRGVQQKGRDLLKRQNKELQFVFDRVFDSYSSNVDVFEGTTKELISSLLEGYNCSVFAYGATGAGKTHTMLGKEGDPGITYKTMAELFRLMDEQQETRNFNLGVSYLEIYNENVQDLLHKAGPLQLREDGRAGVIVAGLKIITITHPEELLSLLARGNRNRTQHPTDANQESSRSHAVFQVYVNITNKLDGQVKHVKLSMIDLAGSERASATGCKGARFKEGANINKSLLALGNCINNLADGVKHIPYRDSKLTRLLKDSLGGNCQTVMIAAVGPSNATFEDTYNTLRYANRAKKIKTQVKKNIVSAEMHVSAYVRMVEEQKKEIESLKQKLLAAQNGQAIAPKPVKDDSEDIAKFARRLTDLFEKKKQLNLKILSLESNDKIMYCRILYKRAADERLRNLTAAVEVYSPEEQNASGKSRIHKSLQHFKRQREQIGMQLKTSWEELCQLEDSIRSLIEEIQAKNLAPKLEDKMNLLNLEVIKLRTQQQFEHGKKINGLQQCEMETMSRLVRTMSLTLQTYYNMMTGGGTITDKLKTEFKQLVKSLEGVRNIKWSDSNISKQEEELYSMTVLSIQHLENPRPDNIPTLNDIPPEDEISRPTDLGKTFVCPIESANLNGTMTIDPNLDDNMEVEVNGLDVDKLNCTFSISVQQDNVKKAQKRVLSDSKNQESISKPSPAKSKKISPPKVMNGLIVQNGKENTKSEQKICLSDKSIKTLNKLKADRLKPIGNPICNGTDNALSVGDAALKMNKDKERRGLSTFQSYQKVNTALPKAKNPPAWQF